MTEPIWPEHGAAPNRYYPWHTSTAPLGDVT